MVMGLETKSYEIWLKEFVTFSLEKRLKKGYSCFQASEGLSHRIKKEISFWGSFWGKDENQWVDTSGKLNSVVL